VFGLHPISLLHLHPNYFVLQLEPGFIFFFSLTHQLGFSIAQLKAVLLNGPVTSKELGFRVEKVPKSIKRNKL